MILNSKRAVASTTAQEDDRQPTRYNISPCRSSKNLKMQLGVVLLHLQTPLAEKERRTYLGTFETLLAQYADLKLCEGLP